jgi:hypothetical protein
MRSKGLQTELSYTCSVDRAGGVALRDLRAPPREALPLDGAHAG